MVMQKCTGAGGSISPYRNLYGRKQILIKMIILKHIRGISELSKHEDDS